MSKSVILTGLRANNDLHIGNYLGALMPIIDLAREKAGDYQVNLFVPDLHSFTTPIDHDKLEASIIENVRAYLALGLPIDHEDVHVYRQSYIPAHSELTWILSCFTGYGEMRRMTQFKEKTDVSHDNLMEHFIHDFLPKKRPELHQLLIRDADDEQNNQEKRIFELFREYAASAQEVFIEKSQVGLFTYPILMAADILLYNAKYVSVGDDQTQHLEFTRDIAERMNNKFGDLFFVPEPVKKQHELFGKDQGLRIRDLIDPSKKMSKSNDTGRGVIFLTDTPDSAKKKIMSATTDSYEDIQYDFRVRPGVSNLLDILELFGGDKSQFIGKKKYGSLKSAVAEVVSSFLTNHQKRVAGISSEYVIESLEQGESAVSPIAKKTLQRVQEELGLRPKKN